MGREEGSGWGTHVYLWQIHFDIWQNQYNIVKLNKIKKKITTAVPPLLSSGSLPLEICLPYLRNRQHNSFWSQAHSEILPEQIPRTGTPPQWGGRTWRWCRQTIYSPVFSPDEFLSTAWIPYWNIGASHPRGEEEKAAGAASPSDGNTSPRWGRS